MSDVSLVLLIGIPGAGKTYLCNNVMHMKTCSCHEDKMHSLENFNIIHVCYDSIIPLDKQKEFRELARSESYEGSWKAEREKISLNVEKLVKILVNRPIVSEIQTSLDSFNFTGKVNDKNGKYIILLDDNFYYRSMRHQFFSIAYKHKIGFCQILFNCSLDRAIENNSKRESQYQIPTEAISEMFNKLQKPASENHWEENCLEFNCDGEQQQLLKCFIALVNKSLKFPADSIEKEMDRREKIRLSEESRVVCSKSFVHQCDILLRQFVGDVLSSSVCKAMAAKNANKARQILLEGLKKGDIALVSSGNEEFNHLLKEQLYKLFIDKYEEFSTL